MLISNEIKVSVIIPMYGVEKYIEHCAKSLFEQTMKEDIEFIFVDDASPDQSVEILNNVLKKYAQRKEQVKIIRHEKNHGLAAARKTGVKVAKGQYIIHCDSDDWVEPNMYELLYDEAKRTNADIVGCDIIEEYQSGSKLLKQDFEIPILDQCKLMLNVGTRNLERYVWNRMFRRSLYNKVGLNNPDVNLWEDICVTIPAHTLAKKVSYVPKGLYHYNRGNSNSLVSSFNDKKLSDMMKAGRFLEKTLQDIPNSKELRKALNNRLLACKLPYLSNKHTFNPSIWRGIWPNLHISTYPSLKMKFIMYLALTKQDYILKKINSIL